MKEQIENYWKIYQSINEWIKFSDTKAGVLLTVYGLILTIIYTNSEKVHTEIYDSLFIIIFSILSGISAIISVAFAFKCINPILKNSNPNSVIYFGHIAQFKTYKNYRDFSIPIISNEIEFIEQLNEQIFVNSKIAQNKFKNIAWAIRFFLLSNTLLIVSLFKYLFI